MTFLNTTDYKILYGEKNNSNSQTSREVNIKENKN